MRGPVMRGTAAFAGLLFCGGVLCSRLLFCGFFFFAGGFFVAVFFFAGGFLVAVFFFLAPMAQCSSARESKTLTSSSQHFSQYGSMVPWVQSASRGNPSPICGTTLSGAPIQTTTPHVRQDPKESMAIFFRLTRGGVVAQSGEASAHFFGLAWQSSALFVAEVQLSESPVVVGVKALGSLGVKALESLEEEKALELLDDRVVSGSPASPHLS